MKADRIRMYASVDEDDRQVQNLRAEPDCGMEIETVLWIYVEMS